MFDIDKAREKSTSMDLEGSIAELILEASRRGEEHLDLSPSDFLPNPNYKKVIKTLKDNGYVVRYYRTRITDMRECITSNSRVSKLEDCSFVRIEW